MLLQVKCMCCVPSWWYPDWHCVPFWNLCHSKTCYRLALIVCRFDKWAILHMFQIGIVCHSEKSAILKHVSDWCCLNVVIYQRQTTLVLSTWALKPDSLDPDYTAGLDLMHFPGALSLSTACSLNPDRGHVAAKGSLNLDPRSHVESWNGSF